jgi:hypothetical protein
MRSEHDALYYQRHKEKKLAANRDWAAANKLKAAYIRQKSKAKHRGIGFDFTFEQWLAWWGDDIDRRGCKRDSLVMARLNDAGDYVAGNVKKITFAQNIKEGHELRRSNTRKTA